MAALGSTAASAVVRKRHADRARCISVIVFALSHLFTQQLLGVTLTVDVRDLTEETWVSPGGFRSTIPKISLIWIPIPS